MAASSVFGRTDSDTSALPQGPLHTATNHIPMHRPALPFLGRAVLSGSELRRLRELREAIRVEAARLPRSLLRELLEVLEAARPWQANRPAVPEMSRPELLRAIRWRLGTIPSGGAEAAGAFLERHRRRRPRVDPRTAGSRKRMPHT
ncbi:MAG TPA: hypothetical protein VGK88_05570 [bacterium]|jgi:hypothetical protein